MAGTRGKEAKKDDLVSVGCLRCALYENKLPDSVSEEGSYVLLCEVSSCQKTEKVTRKRWEYPPPQEQGNKRTEARWTPYENILLILLLWAVKRSPRWRKEPPKAIIAEALRLATSLPCVGFVRIDESTKTWWCVRSESAIRSVLKDIATVDSHNHVILEKLLFLSNGKS